MKTTEEVVDPSCRDTSLSLMVLLKYRINGNSIRINKSRLTTVIVETIFLQLRIYRLIPSRDTVD